MRASEGHDMVAVGASAGGVEALRWLVARLPESFGASLFVVLHLPPHAPSGLAEILDRAGPLPATQVSQRMPIQRSHVYVAPPNQHLVVQRGYVALDAGPRENRARPAVDVLFRSAARAYGRRVVGVVLSGTLTDGALGLAAIKLRGGITIVQDPDEALFPGMPQKALTTATIDYCLPIADIAERLVELTNHRLFEETMDISEFESPEPTEHATDEPIQEASPKHPDLASGLTCPECRGSLWELESGGSGSTRFECRIGHSYSLDALISEQGEAVEAALWSAINNLQERAATFRRLSGNISAGGVTPDYAERAIRLEQQAKVLHELLRGLVVDGLVG